MRTTLCALLVVSLAAGCEEEDEDAWKHDYSFVRHGDNVTLYGYDLSEDDACGGSFEALDTHTRSVMEFLGVDETMQYDYRWMSPDFIDGLCPAGVNACAMSGEPYSQSLPHMHEMVHMVAWDMPNHGCVGLLEEGLGEYLGGPRYGKAAPLDYDIRELMEARENPGPRGYLRAGHFVSFLVEKYGTQTFRELCAAIPNVATLADWDAAIERSLGMSLDELLAEYETYPACTQQQYRARLWECEGEPDYVFDAENRSFVVEADCTDPRATNATPNKRGDTEVTRLVYFTEDTWVSVSPGYGVSFMSQECAPCSAEPDVYREDEETLNLHLFPAGLHEVILFFDKEHPARLRMSVPG